MFFVLCYFVIILFALAHRTNGLSFKNVVKAQELMATRSRACVMTFSARVLVVSWGLHFGSKFRYPFEMHWTLKWNVCPLVL